MQSRQSVSRTQDRAIPLVIESEPRSTKRRNLEYAVSEKALQIMTDAGAQLADAIATIDAIGLLSSGIAQAASASPEPAGGAVGNPFAGLPPEEFPLLTQAAEAGALSDGLADVLAFAVNGMIAALEAKAPPAGGVERGMSRTPE